MMRALALACLLLPALALGGEPEQGRHMGVASCASTICHGSASARADSDLAFNEYVIWSQDDPHARTWQTLLGAQAMEIGRRLGLHEPQAAPVCLGCHVDYVVPERRAERFQLSDGVGCEACHGGAESWLTSHSRADATHADNLARGLYPLDDPLRRAERCLSCHLGNTEKFAGHDIMGAGHPRLQFELVNWSVMQHPHFRDDADYRQRTPQPDTATTWAIGQLATAHNQLLTLAGPRLDASGMWVELALFDCHACHAPMNADKSRPRHSSDGLPTGSIRVNDSALVIAQLLAEVRSATEGRDMLAALRALHAASRDGRTQLRAAAAELDARIVREIAELRIRPLGGAQADAMLIAVVDSASEARIADYLTAEQAAMAADILLRARSSERHLRLAPVLDAVFASLRDQNDFRPAEFRAAMQRLRSAL